MNTKNQNKVNKEFSKNIKYSPPKSKKYTLGGYMKGSGGEGEHKVSAGMGITRKGKYANISLTSNIISDKGKYHNVKGGGLGLKVTTSFSKIKNLIKRK